MQFSSPQFIIFLAVVLALYYAVPAAIRIPLLLISSIAFYLAWNPAYILFLFFTTVTVYIAAIRIERGKRRWFVLTLIANLAVLFFFKYFDFALQNVNAVLGLFHRQPLERPFDLLLPVGISFYMFQAFSYLIDVRRGTIRAERNFLYFFLYMAWFPKLTSGPIERAGHLLPQLHAVKVMGRRQLLNNGISGNAGTEEKAVIPLENFSAGFGLMLWGLFMKMVLADRIGIFVDNVWANLFACGTVETVLAALGYSIQIYCDFAGYSCIAVGVSRMFGIELIQNFETPCFAASIADFWHRWHISLSTWLRDYIYIPLGGSRCSKQKRYLNILLTFLVSGIWHGAAWTFIIWGLLHGLYQIIGDVLKPLRRRVLQVLRVRQEAFSFRLGQIVVTFLLVSFAWIFFRAGSLSQAALFLKRMLTRWNPWMLFNDGIYSYGLDRREFNIFFAGLFLLLLAGIRQQRSAARNTAAAGIIAESRGSSYSNTSPDKDNNHSSSVPTASPRKKIRRAPGMDVGRFLMTQNLAFRWIVYLALILIILVYGEYGVDFSSASFIYSGF